MFLLLLGLNDMHVFGYYSALVVHTSNSDVFYWFSCPHFHHCWSFLYFLQYTLIKRY